MINRKKKFNLHNISDKVKKNIQTFKASREKGIFPFLSNIVIFGSPNKSLSALVKNHENKKIHKNTHTRLREKTHERHPLPPEKLQWWTPTTRRCKKASSPPVISAKCKRQAAGEQKVRRTLQSLSVPGCSSAAIYSFRYALIPKVRHHAAWNIKSPFL